MDVEDFNETLKRLVDSAIGEIPFSEIIECLEGRIGVVRFRQEESEDEDE